MSLDLKTRSWLRNSSKVRVCCATTIDHPRQGPWHQRARAVDCTVSICGSRRGLSQVDLADMLELQPISAGASASTVWSSMACWERRPDPRDRRANRLFLTAGALPPQLVDDLDSLRDSIATDVLQDIPRRGNRKPASRRSMTSRSGSKISAEPPGSRRRQVSLSCSKIRETFRRSATRVGCAFSNSIAMRPRVVTGLKGRPYHRRAYENPKTVQECMMDELNGRMMACQPPDHRP